MSLPTTFRSGALALPSPFLLAPMEGVSYAGFRRLCAEAGAGFGYTEMVRARGLTKRNHSTLTLVDTVDADTPVGVQLLAVSDVELRATFEVLAELSRTTHPHFARIVAVDLNFGCPSQEIIRIGAGPALLKRRAKLRAIFEALADLKKRAVLPSVQSVSAKIRLGLNEQERAHKVYLPVVEMANDTLDHLVIHARHAKQRSRDAPIGVPSARPRRTARSPSWATATCSPAKTRSACTKKPAATASSSPARPSATRAASSRCAARPSPPPRRSSRAPRRPSRASRPRATSTASFARSCSRMRAQAAGQRVEARIPDNAHLG